MSDKEMTADDIAALMSEGEEMSPDDIAALMSEDSNQPSSPESSSAIGGIEDVIGVASDAVGGFYSGVTEEPINEEEYQDLGLAEYSGRKLGQGFAGIPKMAGMAADALGTVGTAIMDPVGPQGVEARETISQIPNNIINAISQNPDAAAEGVGRMGAMGIGAIGGTLAAPGVGTAAGAMVGRTIYDEILNLGKWLQGDEDIKSQRDILLGDNLEDAGGMLFGGTAAKGTRAAVKAVSKGNFPGQFGLRQSAAALTTERSPKEALKWSLAKQSTKAQMGPGVPIDKSVEAAYERLAAEGSAMRSMGTLPKTKQGGAFKTLEDIIGSADDKTSLISGVGDDVGRSIGSIGKQYSLDDIDNFYKRAAARDQFKHKTPEDFTKIKEYKPYRTIAGKNAGYSGAELDSHAANLEELSKLKIKLKGREGKYPASGASAEELANMKRRAEYLENITDEVETRIGNTKLSAKELWDAKNEALEIDWRDDDFVRFRNSYYGRVREEIQNDFIKELGPEAADYLKYNEQYSGLKVISKIAEKAQNSDLASIAPPKSWFKTLVTPSEWGKGDDAHDFIKMFESVDRAFDNAGSIPKSSTREGIYRFLSDGGLPKAARLADSVPEFFTPTNSALLTRTLIAIEDYQGKHPEEFMGGREQITGVVDRMRNAAEKVVTIVTQGQGASESEQRMLMKEIARDPDTRPFLYLDKQEGLLQGIDVFNGQPLSPQDVQKYFINLDNSDLDVFEKAERRKYYNQKGKFMPESKEDKIPDVDDAELEKRINMQKAKEDVAKFKTSKDVVQRSKMSSMMKEREESDLEDVSFEPFERAMNIVRDTEGGFSNHPDDPGGKTNFGVTQSTYNKYLRRTGKPRADVSSITEEEVADIYREYWDEANAGELPWPLSLMVFDAAINSGATTAKKQLQGVLGVKQDGRIGDQTLEALDGKNVNSIAKNFLQEREKFYKGLKNPTFARGWQNRVNKMRRLVA